MSVTIDAQKCTGCEACISECPSEALEMKDGKAVVLDTCIDCGVCIPVCPAEAISEG